MSVNFVQYGVGKMSKYTMRYAMDKGYKLVGAFDVNPAKVGKDVSSVLGGMDLGVIIQNNDKFEDFLLSNKPDIVIVTTMSLIKDVEDALTICAKCGVNAVTICEEAFYPQNSHPTIFEKIDTLAKANKCVITGTGYQDVFWGNLITTLAGATHKIDVIKGQSSYNVEDYGIALAKAHGVGLSLEEFDRDVASADNISIEERNKLINDGDFLPSYMWNVNGWLASKLGLTITEQTQKCVPILADEDMECESLGLSIKKGQARGMSAVVTSKTKEGVTLETQCIGKLYTPDECDINDWSIIGEPNTRVVISRPNTVELTCATCVNRIKDILASKEYGYVTTDKFEVVKY